MIKIKAIEKKGEKNFKYEKDSIRQLFADFGGEISKLVRNNN